MATHSSGLAWRIPGMGEPGGPPSMGSHRVGHDWSDLAAAAAYLIMIPLNLLMPFFFSFQFGSVQLLSRVRLFATPWIEARQASLSINSRSSLRLMPIESVMPSSHLILCRPILLLLQSFPALESFPMSQFFVKLNIQKPKIMASGPITSWQIDGETVETLADFILLLLSRFSRVRLCATP